MSADKNLIVSGARARLKIQGRDIGYATGVSGSEDIEVVPITVLNNPQVKEYVPVGYTATMSASVVYLNGNSLKGSSLFPKTEADPQAHLQNMLTVGSFAGTNFTGLTIEILDRSGSVFMTLSEAQMTSKSWSFGPRDVVVQDVTFVGILMKGESEVDASQAPANPAQPNPATTSN